MITRVKVDVRQIEGGDYLVTASGANSEGEKHENLGTVCEDEKEALDFAKKQLDKMRDMLVEKTGKLPLNDGKKKDTKKE